MAPNRLDRQLTIERPNRVWGSDITYSPTHDGWLYLAVVVDLFSRKIVGWAMASNMETSLVATDLIWPLDAGTRRQDFSITRIAGGIGSLEVNELFEGPKELAANFRLDPRRLL